MGYYLNWNNNILNKILLHPFPLRTYEKTSILYSNAPQNCSWNLPRGLGICCMRWVQSGWFLPVSTRGSEEPVIQRTNYCFTQSNEKQKQALFKAVAWYKLYLFKSDFSLSWVLKWGGIKRPLAMTLTILHQNSLRRTSLQRVWERSPIQFFLKNTQGLQSPFQLYNGKTSNLF